MPEPTYDALCIGNAIVDVFATVEDDFLLHQQVAKGAMILIDEDRAAALYAAMGRGSMVSGGSAANTAAGVALLEARAAYIGKVKDDALGRIFAHDLRATGVHYATALAQEGPASACSYILVTPDGQRTMNTYLGACQNLTVDDIDEAVVRASQVIYLEGYLWDPPAAKDAFRKAAEVAHAAGRQVALSLSDSFCVDRYRAEFLHLIRSKTVDIVFSNESELHALYQTADFDTAVRALRDDCALAAVTRGAEGALVIERDGTRRCGPSRSTGGRFDRGRRPFRGRVPGRPRARARGRRLRPAGRARGGRDHQPCGGAPGGRPRRAGRPERVRALTSARLLSCAEIRIYPVKGLRGIGPSRTPGSSPGASNDDRRWMVVDAQGRFLTQRQVPSMAIVRCRTPAQTVCG